MSVIFTISGNTVKKRINQLGISDCKYQKIYLLLYSRNLQNFLVHLSLAEKHKNNSNQPNFSTSENAEIATKHTGE